MNGLLDIKYWAGTEESFGIYLLCLKKMIDSGELEKFGGSAWGGEQAGAQPAEQVPRLFSMSGDIGVITIAGPLNNSDSRANAWYGMTGYPEIREALIYAAKKPEVGAIMLDVASGGGAVAGVFDTANLISTIDKGVKPVHAFSGGGVMSAAYLLASSARSVNIDQMAEAGSIGVVAVHQEMTKMFAEIGITPTVIRSGKYKALGNPFEPLSDTALAEMQGQVDHLAGIFDQHVADKRGTTAAVVNAKMGQGRIFIGQQAKDVGLVDNVMSFDALATKVQGGIDSSNASPKYGADSTNKNNKGYDVTKAALTAQAIAALELGAGAVEPTAEEKAAAVAEAAVTSAAAAAAAAVTTPATAAKEPTALEVVQGQLAEAQGKVTSLTMEVRDAKAEHDKVKGSHASMRAIAVASTSKLKIALGQTPGGEDALDDTALLAQHEALSKQFTEKFKVGGVAAVAADGAGDKNKGQEVVADSIHKARIAATRPSGNK